MDEIRFAEELTKFIDESVAADQFSGAVLVAKGNVPLVKQAYGLASKDFNVPNQADTKFNLGSMNKMFTAVAIVQLAQQGKISFTDTIRKHLPDYPNAAADKITIHHLLTHTSGMGSYWNDKFDAKWAGLRTVNDFIPLFVDDPLSFEPGEKYQYSNAGFIVLGAIIEHISQQSYFDYIKEHIYEPAAMPDTDAYELDQPVQNRAIGYTHAGPDGKLAAGLRRNNLLLHVVKGGPAGGGYSTVEDMLHFSLALRSYKLLSEQYTHLILTGKVERPDPETTDSLYAYGFGVSTANGKRIVGHRGGAPGINGQFDMYLDLGYTVVVLSNYDPPAATQVARWIQQQFTHGIP